MLRLFVSSPGDVPDERRRVDLVVERLNVEFAGRVRIETVRWETSYYSAHDTFQRQIPEAAECDLVLAVFRGRLGTHLPENFRRLPSDQPYPSGTAYEVLSAIEARKSGKPLPDIFVFRYPYAPSVALDAPDRAEVEAQWERLKGFFDTWFRNRSGEFLAAFQGYSSTDDFARQVEECLRQWLARRGFLAQGAVWDRILLGSPFPGLSAFEADRVGVFFGRDLAIAHAIDRLRQAGASGDSARLPFLLIIGASGSGKSSLLRAGLIPKLTLPGAIPEIDLWRTAILAPGPDPFLSLGESLFAEAALGPELRTGAFRTKEILARQLAGDVDIAVAPIRDALERAALRRQKDAGFETPRPSRVALAVDQAERLFVEVEPARANAFANLIAALVRNGLVYLIVVLRSDAYARFQSVEAFRSLREAGATFDLVPPNAAELEEIVTRPVAACEPPLAFEEQGGRSLAAKLVADAKGGDSLPLLQMSLSRLYAAEAARGDGLLRFADYRGMDAAVTETANEALETLSEAARAELPALVTGLVADVSADPLTGAPTPVISALDRAGFQADRPARKALVEAFVTKRLLTAEGDGVSERVRPAHEALLRIWPRAVAIVAEAANLIRVRHTLGPIVREWEGAQPADKAGHLDISSALLSGAQQLAARYGADLPKAMRDFVAAASAVAEARAAREREAAERRIRDAEAVAAANRRTARGAVAGLAIALALATLAGWQWWIAQRETREAQTQQLAAERAEQDARAQRDRAQRSLALATATANGLVFDLAQKFRNAVGVPASTIEAILERARKLQDELLGSGETSPELLRSQAGALDETANTLLALGDTSGALAVAERSRDIFQNLISTVGESAALSRDLSVAIEKVGDVQAAKGDLTAALNSFQSSLAITERLAKAGPDNALAQRDLSISDERIGDVHRAQGHLQSALSDYKASQTILEALARADPADKGRQRDLSIITNKVGEIYAAQGRQSEALAAFSASLAIAERLAGSDPDNSGWRLDLADAYIRTGDAEKAAGEAGEALRSYQKSIAIDESLTKSDPANVLWRRDLAAAYNRLGAIQETLGDAPASLAAYRSALAIVEAVAKGDPGNAQWRTDVWTNQNNVGDALLAQGDAPAALASYQTAFAIAEQLAKADPTHAQAQRNLAVSYGKLGDVLVKGADRDAGIGDYKSALSAMSRLAAIDPTNFEWQTDLNHFEMALAANGDDAAARYAVVAANLKTLKSKRDLSVEQISRLDEDARSVRLQQQAMPRAQVAIDPATLDAFVGKYRLAWNSVLVIARDGDRLFAKLGDLPAAEVYPEAEREFFSKVAPAQISFLGQGKDPAPAVVIHMLGYDVTAKRLDEAQEQARAEALARRIRDNAPNPGSEAALRHAIEAVQSGEPDYDQMTDPFAQVARQYVLATKKLLSGGGALQRLKFLSVDPDGGDEYAAEFAHAKLRCRIVLTDEGKIDFVSLRPDADAAAEDRRIKPSAPTPGSEAALRHAIEAAQRGEPDYGQMGPELAEAVRSKFARIQRELVGFGELKTLTFQQNAAEGGDDYVTHFANADVHWRIVMGANGRIDALYYNALR